MQVTKKTRTREVLPLLNSKRMEEILKKVPAIPLKKHVVDFTVGEFIQAMTTEWVVKQVKRRRKALDALGWLRSFRKEMAQIQKFIEKCQPPQDEDAKAAAVGVNFPTPQERMLLDCVKAFGLKRMDGKFLRYGATDVPLAEYLILVKDQAASAKYQYNLNKIQSKKWENGRKN